MATLSGSGIENFRKVLSGDVHEMLPKADLSAVLASQIEPLDFKVSKNCAKDGLEEQNIEILYYYRRLSNIILTDYLRDN